MSKPSKPTLPNHVDLDLREFEKILIGGELEMTGMKDIEKRNDKVANNLKKSMWNHSQLIWKIF